MRLRNRHLARRHRFAELKVGLPEEPGTVSSTSMILTDHDEFDYEMVGATANHVLDTRRRLRPNSVVEVL